MTGHQCQAWTLHGWHDCARNKRTTQQACDFGCHAPANWSAPALVVVEGVEDVALPGSTCSAASLRGDPAACAALRLLTVDPVAHSDDQACHHTNYGTQPMQRMSASASACTFVWGCWQWAFPVLHMFGHNQDLKSSAGWPKLRATCRGGTCSACCSCLCKEKARSACEVASSEQSRHAT